LGGFLGLGRVIEGSVSRGWGSRRVGRSRRADERGRSENELAASTAPSGVWLEGRRGARALPGIGFGSVSAKARAPCRRLFTSFRPRRVEKAEPSDRGLLRMRYARDCAAAPTTFPVAVWSRPQEAPCRAG